MPGQPTRGRREVHTCPGQQPLHPREPRSRGDRLLGPGGLPLRRWPLQEAGVVIGSQPRVFISGWIFVASNCSFRGVMTSEYLWRPQKLFDSPSASSGSSTYDPKLLFTRDCSVLLPECWHFRLWLKGRIRPFFLDRLGMEVFLNKNPNMILRKFYLLDQLVIFIQKLHSSSIKKADMTFVYWTCASKSFSPAFRDK